MTRERVHSRTDRPCISQEAFKQMTVGDLIIYLLSPHRQPTNPLREWHGRIEQVSDETVWVSSLDEGYIGLTEIVSKQEIIAVKKGVGRHEVDR
jgi:hypothetical protein